MMIIISIQSSF